MVGLVQEGRQGLVVYRNINALMLGYQLGVRSQATQRGLRDDSLPANCIENITSMFDVLAPTGSIQNSIQVFP